MKTTIRANPENDSMDETMKSLDDLLPPPEKPKREFSGSVLRRRSVVFETSRKKKLRRSLERNASEITQRIGRFRRRTWESDAVEFVREYYLSRLGARGGGVRRRDQTLIRARSREVAPGEFTKTKRRKLFLRFGQKRNKRETITRERVKENV